MTFADWLSNELELRGWSQSDLARAADVSRGSINNLLTNMRNPGPDLCTSIARAFNYPPDIVFRKAGLLPEKIKESEEFQEIKHRYHSASEEIKRDILDYVRYKTRDSS